MKKNSIKFSNEASKAISRQSLVLISSEFYRELNNPAKLRCDINPGDDSGDIYIDCPLSELRNTLLMLQPNVLERCIINLKLSSGEYLSSFGSPSYNKGNMLDLGLDFYYDAINLSLTTELYHDDRPLLLITEKEFNELIQNFMNHIK